MPPKGFKNLSLSDPTYQGFEHLRAYLAHHGTARLEGLIEVAGRPLSNGLIVEAALAALARLMLPEPEQREGRRRAARELLAAGWTQAEIARKFGVHRGTVCKWLR